MERERERESRDEEGRKEESREEREGGKEGKNTCWVPTLCWTLSQELSLVLPTHLNNL